MYRIPRVFTEAERKGFKGFRRIPSPIKLADPKDPAQEVLPTRYTHRTIINGRAPKETSNKNMSEREMWLWIANTAEVFSRPHAFTPSVREIAAVIGGMPVVLRTNSAHLANFWGRNWYLVDRNLVYDAHERFGIPYVTIRAAIADPNAPEKSAKALYCPSTHEIVFWNTDYYGQCKSWALGAAGVVLAHYDVHSIHGACVEMDGPSFTKRGILLIAPTGTGKSTYTNVLSRIHELDKRYRGRINSDDWVYVKDGVATPSERYIYVRTNAVDDRVPQWALSDTMAKMKRIFDASPCENVPLDGKRRLYGAVGNSRAMINPTRLSELAYATPVNLVVLLRRDPDPNVPFFEELDAAQAVAVLEDGRYMVQPGSGPQEEWGTMKNEAWYNPYLLVPDVSFERRKFAELKEKHGARFVVFNTSKAVAPKEFGIHKPETEISTTDVETTVEGTARLMLELLSGVK